MKINPQNISIILLAAFIAGCAVDHGPPTPTEPEQRVQAPAIGGEAWLNGPPPSVKGKVVVVDVWASW